MNRKSIFALFPIVVLCVATASVHAQTGPSSPSGGAPGAAAQRNPGDAGRAPAGLGGGRPGVFVPPGPPAPVPPQVVMPRPTPEELVRINASLKQFIESNTTPEKALLKKYESLILLRMPRDNPCIRPTPGIRGMRHARFVETAKSGDFDILFLGDSITDLWNVEHDRARNPGGKRVFDKYFGDIKVANFGVSGDRSSEGSLQPWRKISPPAKHSGSRCWASASRLHTAT